MEHSYPSDITREQFETVRPDLEAARRKTRPRKHDLYDIFCAVLYIVRNGVQWRSLTVWKEPGQDGASILDRILKKNHLVAEAFCGPE